MPSVLRQLTSGMRPLAESLDRLRDWFWDRGCWFTISSLAHGILLLSIALLPFDHKLIEQPLSFEAVDTTIEPELEHLGDVPLDPTELNTDTLTLTDPPSQTEKHYDDAPRFVEQGGGVKIAAAPNVGGLGGFSVFESGRGPATSGAGGIGAGGEGDQAGLGGVGEGFGRRGQGHREKLGAYGGTQASERAVAAALDWFYRHQSGDGSWSLEGFNARCKGQICSGAGMHNNSNSAGTSLALLPFLAAGQTHKSPGPYLPTIRRGINWLVKHQKSDGDLSAGGEQLMYAHGLATITLCEAFGLTRDRPTGEAAQRAIRFIEQAQNQTTGGWRYHPGEAGDTSVVGWQIMALKSAQMAGLAVDSECLERARRFLALVARGENGGQFSYLPYDQPTPTMTAVGLLCKQYLGAAASEPAMLDGKKHLLDNQPDGEYQRNTYYWYYATQVMHNFVGPEWDIWNRKMRRVLIESQVTEGCGRGSWDPANPSPDAWGTQGGRIMTTSLSTLTLEIYYRYLPLYRLDGSSSQGSLEEPEPEPDKLTLQNE